MFLFLMAIKLSWVCYFFVGRSRRFHNTCVFYC